MIAVSPLLQLPATPDRGVGGAWPEIPPMFPEAMAGDGSALLGDRGGKSAAKIRHTRYFTTSVAEVLREKLDIATLGTSLLQ